MIALAEPRTTTLADLVQAVVDAAAAERAYFEGPVDPDSLRDLELFDARMNAEAALRAALVAQGVPPAHARTMAEALA